MEPDRLISVGELATLPEGQPASKEPVNRDYNTAAVAGFGFGVCSMFCDMRFGILPLLAVVMSVAGLLYFKPESQRGRWLAVVGLLIGIFWTIFNVVYYAQGGRWK